MGHVGIVAISEDAGHGQIQREERFRPELPRRVVRPGLLAITSQAMNKDDAT